MKYISLDIETTGLEKETSQVLQVGMILVDTKIHDFNTPLEVYESIEFNIYPKGGKIQGDLFALNMNSKIIECILNKENIVFHEDVEDTIINKIKEWIPEGKVTIAGKNAASFDIPFLVHHFPKLKDLFHHRTIDVGTMYLDTYLHRSVPSLIECKRLAGLSTEVIHTALMDAYDVVRLERYKNS